MPFIKLPKSINHLLHHPSVASFMASLPTAKQLFFSIIGVATLSFLLISLLSYTPTDPAWSHVSSNNEVTNIAGRSGAWVADIFHLFFGFGAWWLIFVITYELLHLWIKPSVVVWQLRGMAYGFMLTIISALLAWWGGIDSESALRLGGLVGSELYSGLTANIGVALTLVFLVGLGLFIITLTFDIHWFSLINSLFSSKSNIHTDNTDNTDKLSHHSTKNTTDSAMFDVVQIHHPKQYTPHNHTGTLESFLQESGLREELISEQQKPAKPTYYGYPSDTHHATVDTDANNKATGVTYDNSPTLSTAQPVTQTTTQTTTWATASIHETINTPDHPTSDIYDDEQAVMADIFSDEFMQSLHDYEIEQNLEHEQEQWSATQHSLHKEEHLEHQVDTLSHPNSATTQSTPVDIQDVINPVPTAFDGIHINEVTSANKLDTSDYSVMTKTTLDTPDGLDINKVNDSNDDIEGIEGLDALFGHLNNEQVNVSSPNKQISTTITDIKTQSPTTQAQPKSRAMGVLEHRLSLTPVPELTLLDSPEPKKTLYTPLELQQLSDLLEIKLQEYNISAKVVSAMVGPVVTRFEVELAAGVKVSRVVRITEDLARTMMVPTLRVLPIIAGKPYIGIEIPNKHRQIVSLIELLDTADYRDPALGIALAVGVDISGKPVIADLAKAPHMLVAGTTGSGKSVLVNSLLLSMLLKYTPDELKLVLIDPKQLELANYADIPHLLTPVITDMTEATAALTWCVTEMERRYKLLSLLRVRNIASFNQAVQQAEARGEPLLDPLWRPNDSVSVSSPPRLKPLANIVVVADEFADMIMQLGKTAEEPIVRLAQKSRAAGIHLILATQRPTANVVTGLIKSNIPSRVALKVGSQTDSRIIIEESGAENMLGHGDMMFLAPGKPCTERLHGAYVKDAEVNRVADAWRERGSPDYIDLSNSYSFEGEGSGDMASSSNSDDEYYDKAVAIVLDTRKVSISSIQRKLSIGYNRAARIVDMMEEQGLVSPMDNNGKRQLLV